MSFKGFKLRLSRRLGEVNFDHLLARAEILFPALKASTDDMLHLAVQDLLDLCVVFLGFLALFGRPRHRLDVPDLARVLDRLILLLQSVFNLTFLHLLLPYLSVLPLCVLSIQALALLLLLELFDLSFELLLLADEHVHLLREALLHHLALVAVM